MTNKSINDQLAITGDVSIILRDKYGQIKLRKAIKNLVVQSGKNLIAATFRGDSSDTITHIGVGTNTPAAAADISQVALQDEILPRVAISSTLNSSPSNIVYVATFGAGVGTGNIGEAGLFTASTVGTMVSRTTFTTIPKEADDEIEITWTLNFS